MRSIVRSPTDARRLTGAAALDDSALAWLEEVRRHLDDLAHLESDWDFYGALPPTPVALSAADQVLATVAGRFGTVAADDARPTSVSPLPTGGVEIEWRRNEVVLAVDVGPQGSLGYLIRTGAGGDATYREETHVAEGALLELLGDLIVSAE